MVHARCTRSLGAWPKMPNSTPFSQALILSSFDRNTRRVLKIIYQLRVSWSNSFTLKLGLIREKELDFGNFGQVKQAERV